MNQLTAFVSYKGNTEIRTESWRRQVDAGDGGCVPCRVLGKAINSGEGIHRPLCWLAALAHLLIALSIPHSDSTLDKLSWVLPPRGLCSCCLYWVECRPLPIQICPGGLQAPAQISINPNEKKLFPFMNKDFSAQTAQHCLLLGLWRRL